MSLKFNTVPSERTIEGWRLLIRRGETKLVWQPGASRRVGGEKTYVHARMVVINEYGEVASIFVGGRLSRAALATHTDTIDRHMGDGAAAALSAAGIGSTIDVEET